MTRPSLGTLVATSLSGKHRGLAINEERYLSTLPFALSVLVIGHRLRAGPFLPYPNASSPWDAISLDLLKLLLTVK